MNLCGGIIGVSEHELVLRIPDDEFNVTSKRKKSLSSSAPSRRNKSTIDQSSLRTPITSSSNRPSTRSSRGSSVMPSSQSSTSTSISTSTPPFSMLNPVSRSDYQKLKSRHRSHPLRGRMKSSSILTKKLESGFNLVSEKKQFTVEYR